MQVSEFQMCVVLKGWSRKAGTSLNCAGHYQQCEQLPGSQGSSFFFLHSISNSCTVSVVVPPCRSLCLAVNNDCYQVLEPAHYYWNAKR